MLITGGLVAVAALVGGAILFTSSRASEINLTTASLVPADAGFYAALNTDLTSGQWVSTFGLAERLGTDDPEDELKDGVEEGGLDWEDDIAPFLGGNAAVFLNGVSIFDQSAEGAVILRCKDSEAAWDVLDDQMGFGDDDEYEGVEYFEILAIGGGYAARIEDHIVLAFDLDSLEAVIDVHNGEADSLAGVEDFQTLRDELTGNFLAFLYVSSENLFGDFLTDDPSFKEVLEQSGSSDLVLKPSAWVVGATKDGFEFQAASIGDAGVISPMIAPRESAIAKIVPADSAFFFSTFAIAETWEAALKDSRPQLDDLIREDGEFRDLDDAMRAAGEELGIESIEEVIALLKGETAFAGYFNDNNEDSFEGLLIAEVDEDEAKDLFEAIAESVSTSAPRTRTLEGVEVTEFVDEDGDEAAYAFMDGMLLIGTPDGVEWVIEGQSEPPLAQLNRYLKAKEQLPTSLGTYGYFNLTTLLRLTEGSVPVDLDEAERALEGLIINVVDERGVVRTSGILTIDE